jgi:phosphoribosylformylglycinamidine synthase
MSALRAGIVVFPGTNRERDMAIALERATGRRPAMLWHRDAALPPGLDLVVLPGGFSYGDYLRCGAIAARSPIMRAVADHAARGGLILGVCNGFQILCEAGLLPGALLRNATLRFLAMDCLMRVERTDTPFTARYAPGAIIRAPLAHGDGNYVADEPVLDRLEGEGLVAFRYVNEAGEALPAAAPNGAARNIAGIFSENRRILGLMPHPEDLVDPLMGGTDGLALFESLAEAA